MIPTNQDFATEVKADRLGVLWRSTLFASIVAIWIVINISILQRSPVGLSFVPFVALAIGCVITRRLLRAQAPIFSAAWVYSLSAMAALAIGLAISSPQMIQILPFAFPVVVFMVGLLLTPGNTLATAVLSVLLTIFAPVAQTGNLDHLSAFTTAAIALTFVSALLAMQVTGDLYQISQWALANYQRERAVAGELFDSRQELQRSLARSEALGERLQEANEQLEAARTAAEEAKHFRGQFLANMSHELRTPLNAIIGFSETMLKFPAMYEGINLPPAYEADLQQIYSSGRQLLNLINDILDLSKVDAGKLDIRMDKVDLTSVASSAVSTAAGLIGSKPIKLEVDVQDGLPYVWADRARVSQVILNLYSNAAKFTDEGVIRLTIGEAEDKVLVALSDTGAGIPPGSLELIFEEFKQADTAKRDPRSGAGLGLAISRQLLNLMGGEIWVESELGIGSTFYFTLQPYREEIVSGSEQGYEEAVPIEESETLQEKVS